MNGSARLAHDLERRVRLIAGVDEAGAGGAWAGPLVVVGVLFDLERLVAGQGREMLEEVNDSKGVAPAKCERLARDVMAHADAVSIVSIPAGEIDRVGLGVAHRASVKEVLRTAGMRADLCLVDGNLALGADALDHEAIPKGDETSATIAAASIVAKATHDHLMACLGERYPGWGFEIHNGYRGDGLHAAALTKLGPSPEHRLNNRAVIRYVAEWRANGGGS